MDRVSAAGIATTAGYAVGVLAPYPGRSATLAGVIVGLTPGAVGR